MLIHILGGEMISAILIHSKHSKSKVFLITFIFFLVYVVYDHLCFKSSLFFFNHRDNENDPIIRISPPSADLASTTNISHIVFAISGSVKTWRHRGPYIDLWWRPNHTRGRVWLDKAPIDFPWPSSSLPFQVYDRFKHRYALRMARMILEIVRLGSEEVRWFVKADDDTIIFVDNLVEVLAKYDHNGYYYIGGNSECIAQNDQHSFNMALGGAGFAVSYPLAKVLARNLDGCIKRYQTFYGEDHLIQFCMAELGVSFTREPGLHQIDLHGDISGFLSAHPRALLLSLHHIHMVDPIFPSMSRYDALHNLMQAAKVDSSRVLQQIICYHHQNRWSAVISWGYSVQIYKELHPPGLLIPIQTFQPWNRKARPPFMFNVRQRSSNSCVNPHIFYLESVEFADSNQIVTSYIRSTPWRPSFCGNHSVESVSKIKVYTTATGLRWVSLECVWSQN